MRRIARMIAEGDDNTVSTDPSPHKSVIAPCSRLAAMLCNRARLEDRLGLFGGVQALPYHRASGGGTMDTFFVRKQLIVGAVLLGCLEVGVVLFNILTH
jgi:hypothetical protein